MLEDARTGAQGLWNGLNGRQRAVVLVSAGLIAVSLVLVLNTVARKPDYAPLYGNLDPREAGEIVKQLTDRKVPYELAQGGTVIRVPAREVDGLRVALAAEGFPKGGSAGLELFAPSKLVATEFERQVQYTMALQGELERTFRQIEGVDRAKVLIVLPEESAFVSQRRPASASVFLVLEPGSRLEPNQVKSIARLTANSVKGLRPEAVAVVDSTGRTLSAGLNFDDAGDASSLAAAPSSQLELQRQFQTNLERSVQSLLEQVLGPGNVAARVTAELDFDQTATETTRFSSPTNNNQGLLTNIEEFTKSFEGSTDAGQVVGVQANAPGQAVPTYPSVAPGPSRNSAEELQRRATYAVDKIVEQSRPAQGRVKRLSVAVMVNSNLTPQQQQAIENTVAAAAGIDARRGDQVTVTGMAFNTQMLDAMRQAEAAQRQAARASLRNYLIAGGAIGVLALFMFLRSRRKPEASDEFEGMPLPGAMVMAGAGGATVAVGGPAPQPDSEPILSRQRVREKTPDELEKERLEQEIHKLAESRPEDVAALLKTWLAEDDE